jgi:hypothetical protein
VHDHRGGASMDVTWSEGAFLLSFLFVIVAFVAYILSKPEE